MIHAIIFSKNRAAQLHLLLESIEKYAKGIFDITVLYAASDEEFEEGYQKLFKEFNVNVAKQVDFRTDLLKELNKPYRYTAYFCDDDVFYQPIVKGLTDQFTENTITLSLHLGKNNEYCYTHNRPVSLGPHTTKGEYIRFDYRHQELDFAYPLTVTSHIFRTQDIKKITEQIPFQSPNEYESNMQGIDIGKYDILSYKTSRVVNNPANIVQTVYENRYNRNTLSAKDLNDKYLNGEVIDITCVPTEVSATHQEFEYTFKNG